jgi:hypothetical protein
MEISTLILKQKGLLMLMGFVILIQKVMLKLKVKH